MIEIKTRTGRVLYTDKTATDIRQAVQEAVKERAYLAGANLAGANLAADIAAIPVGTDGKFRVHRCVVVDEITDLASRGIGS